MPRLGMMGGTFDPIHTGHLLLAQFLKEHLALDRVLFVLAADPPHKESRGGGLLPVEDRWEMVCAALAGSPDFEPCRIEIDRPGKSYTVETLRQLRQRHPGSELFLLLGADNVAELDTWYDPEGIFELCTVVAGSRPGPVPPWDSPLTGRVTLVDTPVIDISSTGIRERVSAGLPIRWLVPGPVESYIRENGLYR
ncbi:MAG: nicotinate-nucleotide adenylyltransferase [Gemmatimonadetes bacterium]|nr:nicotinate-nucleotide adenylyltransferase [Gemmatimonadota bacterium]